MKSAVHNNLRALLHASVGSASLLLSGAVSPALGGSLTGPSVAIGQASVTSPNPTNTLITQSTAKALINWHSFSVASGSSVTFQQPNSAAITLNRVIGPELSSIQGSLFANGQVWLINSNGILFGPGSRINVGGLLATTSDIRDQDFASGHYDFGIASGNPNAAIINQGSIRAASGGSVVLAAKSVANEGLIQADLGQIVLAGANTFSVDFDGDNLIRFAVGDSADGAGDPAPGLLSNSGKISAAGGKVLLTARAARSVVDKVINTSGIIEATTISEHNGEIVLDAGPTGTVSVTGVLDVSGRDAGETGGSISILGKTVVAGDGARLDASGDQGGGTVRIGGNFRGAGPEPNAQTATIGEAVITANATGDGDGGKIVVWSDGATKVAGSLSATGGAKGGDGGVIETSGHNLTIAAGTRVDTTAANGATGSWLLDPLNIDVASAGATALTGGVLAVDVDPGATDIVDPVTIVTSLATTNVRLEASNDITVTNPIFYASANSLTFLAQHNVVISASVQNGGAGDIFLQTGGDIIVGGASALGGVAVGSAGGTTVVSGANVALAAINGYAQIGFLGGGSGSLQVAAFLGDLALSGGGVTGAYAQIGHGGYLTSGGNASGDIFASANGTVVLTGGSGTEAYSQIGHGGAETNKSSSGYSNTGTIVVTGADVNLNAGHGNASYAQIGHGGYQAGVLLSGQAINSGNIVVAATNAVHLKGDGDDAYAQIGNGGDQVNSVAAAGATGVDVGDVTVESQANTAVSVTLTSGAGANAYAQIGNGGYSINAPGNAAPAGFSNLGTISVVADGALTLTGGGNVNAYAQIGNGGQSSSGNDIGDVIVSLGDDLSVTGGNTADAYAEIGNGGGLAKSSAGGRVFAASGRDITLASGALLSANSSGDALVLAAQNNFINLAGIAALNVSGGGRWLIFSLDPAHQSPGGLSASPFYNRAFDFSTESYAPIASTGNRFVYQLAPVLTVTADNTTKTYGSANPLFTATITGLLGGDTLTGAVSGAPSLGTTATARSQVGNYPIVAALGNLASDYNYSFQVFGGTLSIRPATLTAGLTGSVSRLYDGTLTATLVPGNYTLSKAQAGDSVALNNPASGAYGDKNVGSGKLVSVSGLALIGADASNYVLASTDVSGAIGQIAPGTLTAGLTGSVSKFYDGTIAATLVPGNYTLSGAVAGDGVALNNPASGTYDNNSVGTDKLVTVSGLALIGAGAGNYVLDSTIVSGAVGVINAVTTVDTVAAAPATQGVLATLSGVGPANAFGPTNTLFAQQLFTPQPIPDVVLGPVAPTAATVAADSAEGPTAAIPGLAVGPMAAIPGLAEGPTAAIPASVGPLAADPIAALTREMGANGEAELPTSSDVLTQSIGGSLDGKPNPQSSRTLQLIGGLLSQAIRVPGAATSRGVPPADQNFSSWGNRALWQ
jgi:filamentous hemagglutinin family protein